MSAAIFEDIDQFARQLVAEAGYRRVVCHGDESTYERCLARRFIFGVYTPEAIERIVVNRIAHSHSRPDGRGAPLRFDDLNALLRQIRAQASRPPA